jgi:hypothetical protein
VDTNGLAGNRAEFFRKLSSAGEIEGMKPIEFSDHALERMIERGTTRPEVEEAIRHGREAPARSGKIAFRLNLQYQDTWKGKYYGTKQVSPIVVEEMERFVVVTVLTFYF